MNFLRGDIFFVSKFNKSVGTEQEDGRPAVIVSNNVGNQYSEQVEVVYLTTQDKKPLPTHVNVMCRVPSTALCEQVHTVSKERLDNFIRSATAAEMAAIDEALKISLALSGDAEKEILEEQKRIIDNQGQQINTLVAANSKLKMQLDHKEETAIDSSALLTVQVERDTYKRLYENLLEKVMK